jgi:hypothetical protein
MKQILVRVQPRLCFWGLPLSGLLLLAVFAARWSVPAAWASGSHALYLPLVTRPGTSGGNGGTAASFFLPNRPGGSIVTTGQPKVAVDANGGVHVVYAARAPDSTGRRPAYYAYCAAHCAGPADFAVVALGDLMFHAELALDPQGHPRVLLTRSDVDGNLFFDYAECDSACTLAADWHIANAAAGEISFFPSRSEGEFDFALDPLGRPRFVFFSNPFGQDDGGTFYAACDSNCTSSAHWISTKLTDDELKSPSLAFTSSGGARLAYTFVDPNTYEPQLAYAECSAACANGANWNGAVLLGTVVSGAFSDNVFVLRVDANNHLGLALYPGSGDGGTLPPGRLYYLTCAASCLQAANWNALDVGLPDYSGEGGLDLTYDSQARPRLAVRLPAPADELAYAWCDTSCAASAAGWDSQLVPSTALAQQEFPLLAMQGCPSPECIPPIPPCSTAFWDGGYWPSLALDSVGNPRLAFDLKHQQFGGGCPSGTDVRMARYVSFDQP